jgi:hypothetical protein
MFMEVDGVGIKLTIDCIGFELPVVVVVVLLLLLVLAFSPSLYIQSEGYCIFIP